MIEDIIIESINQDLELLTPETLNLLGSTKNKTTEDENNENVPHLEITEVKLVHCNIVYNDYQHDLLGLYTFGPINFFGQLSDISSQNLIFQKIINSDFLYIEVYRCRETIK